MVRGFAAANRVHRTISAGNKMRDADGASLYPAAFTCVASIYIGTIVFFLSFFFFFFVKSIFKRTGQRDTSEKNVSISPKC